MKLEKISLVYFSPTSTTRIVLEEIAKGMDKIVTGIVDITHPEIRNNAVPEFKDEVVLIGAPVYAGRIPQTAARYFKSIKARGIPAVLVVLYGNREFDDALLELKDICVACGFVPLAAGAFIGEHSFCNDEFSIAPGRPDKKDLEMALIFGKQIAGLLDRIDNVLDMAPLDVPGNFPYKEGMSPGAVPFIDVTEDCDDCGICMTVCPENAIDETDTYSTLDDRCIYCCACIKACPQQARILKDSHIKDKAMWLSENCSERKDPRTFLPGGTDCWDSV